MRCSTKWFMFLAKLKRVYDLISTFLGPDAGEEQEGKFLRRSICWRTDVQLVKKMMDEWDMCEAKEVETSGTNDEYDVQNYLTAAMCRRAADELIYLAIIQEN